MGRLHTRFRWRGGAGSTAQIIRFRLLDTRQRRPHGLPPVAPTNISGARRADVSNRDRLRLWSPVANRADQLGHWASHSLSFDHRRPVCFPFTAIAIAFFCPTMTTSRLPRVTAV